MVRDKYGTMPRERFFLLTAMCIGRKRDSGDNSLCGSLRKGTAGESLPRERSGEPARGVGVQNVDMYSLVLF